MDDLCGGESCEAVRAEGADAAPPPRRDPPRADESASLDSPELPTDVAGRDTGAGTALSPEDVFVAASVAHRAGRLTQAERRYTAILDRGPEHVSARHEDAIALVRAAARLDPGDAGRSRSIPATCAPDWRWLLGRNDSPWYPAACWATASTSHTRSGRHPAGG